MGITCHLVTACCAGCKHALCLPAACAEQLHEQAASCRLLQQFTDAKAVDAKAALDPTVPTAAHQPLLRTNQQQRTFARYDLPVPGGPYSRIPVHGLRLPVKNCRGGQAAPPQQPRSACCILSHAQLGLLPSRCLAGVRCPAGRTATPCGAQHLRELDGQDDRLL